MPITYWSCELCLRGASYKKLDGICLMTDESLNSLTKYLPRTPLQNQIEKVQSSLYSIHLRGFCLKQGARKAKFWGNVDQFRIVSSSWFGKIWLGGSFMVLIENHKKYRTTIKWFTYWKQLNYEKLFFCWNSLCEQETFITFLSLFLYPFLSLFCLILLTK